METYAGAIKDAILLFPAVAAVITLPYVIYNYHEFGSVLSLRCVVVYSFVLYLLCTCFLVVLPLPSRAEVAAMTGTRVQLVPLTELKQAMTVFRVQGFNLSALKRNTPLWQFVFNMLMLAPFGAYLHYYFRCGWKRTVLFSFLLSLLLELTQLTGLWFIYPRSYRTFDVDDLLANTLGGLLGFLIIWPVMALLPGREELDELSLRRGREVSVGRRITACVIDLLLLAAIGGMIALLLRGSGRLSGRKQLAGVVGLFVGSCYPLVPLLFRGRSVGKYLTQLRVVDENGHRARWYQLLLRCLGLYLIPVSALVIAGAEWQLYRDGHLSANAALLSGELSACFYAVLILFCLAKASLHKQLYYERLSHTQLISTIRAQGRNSENTEI